MILRSEQGSTLIENVVAVFVLSIFSAMILSTFLAGLSVYTDSYQEYTRINTVFSDIEQTEDVANGTTIQEQSGSISFMYDGELMEIEGTYRYDVEGDKLGEFVAE